MDSSGPIYCETLHANAGLIEPVNALTSLVPVLVAGAVAWYLARRSSGSLWYEYGLLILLAVTGIGSFLWHGFRTNEALLLDVLPGLTLYAGIVVLWFTRLLRVPQALMLAALFVAAHAGVLAAALLAGAGAAIATAMAATGIFAFTLVALTYQRAGARHGRTALLVILLAAGALLARTLDLSVCAALPFGIGSHFLWHLLLSAAAGLGVVLLHRLSIQARHTV
jgi:hypothetical protein